MADIHKTKVLQHFLCFIDLRKFKCTGICLYLQKKFKKAVNKYVPSVDRTSILPLIYLGFNKKIQKDLTSIVYRLYSKSNGTQLYGVYHA